ncbi:hypothetical protein PHYSODRAFT_332318 [Phytophthora sojae]|uniref:Ankyrin repeat protein n=1 Tax=Phytophthora sojae (strain P6497) TaxID=1094619 RepID=G4ZGB3_PHYSP|nr:hypothetical protein PHYSODRAFT_332318 [Phytophthora sojae]EGZ18558.1 hypothetical protein PHYSODRAFT_332318 [Phytophthora sojae]|eukprot:XP_009527616.1 hypothetical protein PHYSODRAFT_332318 [Phytophthora sojae]
MRGPTRTEPVASPASKREKQLLEASRRQLLLEELGLCCGDTKLDLEFTTRRLLHCEPHYQQFRFTYSLVEAARQNDLDMVKWLFEHFDSRYDVAFPALDAAARSGALEILQFFYDNDDDVDHSNESESSGESDGEESLDEQHGGEVDTQDVVPDRGQEVALGDDDDNGAEVEQQSQEGPDESADDGEWRRYVGWGDELAAVAADAGHNAVAIWIAQYSVHIDRAGTMRAAIASGNIDNGHLHMLEWLEDKSYLGDRTGLLVQAAEGGQMEIVRWLVELDWDEGYLDSDSDSEHGKTHDLRM